MRKVNPTYCTMYLICAALNLAIQQWKKAYTWCMATDTLVKSDPVIIRRLKLAGASRGINACTGSLACRRQVAVCECLRNMTAIFLHKHPATRRYQTAGIFADTVLVPGVPEGTV